MSAAQGAPASQGSLRVAARNGLDLSGHLSCPVGSDLLGWADLILVMSPGHLFPLAEMGVMGKAAVLDAFAKGGDGTGEAAEVPDPFGGDDRSYEETYQTLEDLVDKALHQLELQLAP